MGMPKSCRRPSGCCTGLLSACAWALAVVLLARPAAAGRALQEGEVDAAAQEPYNPYPKPTTVPEEFVLRNETLTQMLDRIATPRREIIFTTMRFGDGELEDVLGMISNYCYWLNQHGLLQHTMLLTTDDTTWELVRDRGFPIYLDRVFPRRDYYIDQVEVRNMEIWNREFDVQKHWWGMRLVELGYRVLYSDSDAVMLQDPLVAFREPYEVQGLSDWFETELLPTGAAAERHCNLYKWVKDPRMQPMGSMLREWWHVHDIQIAKDSAQNNSNPCQSTGLWYLQPTNLTVRFMQHLVRRIAWDAPWQWDQTAWNDVIMAYLWGMGNDGQLRYRILPVEQYANTPIYEARKKAGLPVDPVVLHTGAVHGPNKTKAFQNLGIWHGDFMDGLHLPLPKHLLPHRRHELHGAVSSAIAVPLVVIAAAALAWGGRRLLQEHRRQRLRASKAKVKSSTPSLPILASTVVSEGSGIPAAYTVRRKMHMTP